MSWSMRQEIRDRIRAATEESGITKPDFVELLQLIDQHYDKMEATITQSIQSSTFQDSTPIEAIFDSVTDALLSVGINGTILNCNKVCTRYFGLGRNQLVGASLARILPGADRRPVAEFLSPYLSSLEDTQMELKEGEVEALHANGEAFVAEINASELSTAEGPVFVISLRDVTGRKEAESVLRENEDLSRARRERSGSNHCLRRRRESLH